MLILVAVAVVASLDALGALLVSALFVLPAATARLWTRTLLSWQVASVALAAVEGTLGLWLAFETNVPPGAAIAVIGGAVFAVAALPRSVPALAVAALLLAGAARGGNRPAVVATTTEIGDWARVVAGDELSVHQILRPNTDPHEYEPRPDDVRATSGAKVVFENGLGLDGWMGKVVSSAGGDARVVDLGSSVVDRIPGDPHWWHDPRNAAAAVAAIRDALVQADPQAARDAAPERRRVPAQACARSTPSSQPASRRCRARSGSSSPTTTRSATSRGATGSTSSAPSSRRSRRRLSRRPARRRS